MTEQTPCFRSLALREIPEPDYADVCLATLPAGASTDPAEWAQRLFSMASMPRWISGAMRLRQALVPLVGIPRAPRDVFTVTEQSGEEALIFIPDRHLDCAIAVGVDPVNRILRVTTAVELKGRRGRLYFGVVRPLHPIIVDSMLQRHTHPKARRNGR